jgi:hypothetical protein
MDKISVRGQECAWTTVYYNKIATPVSNDLIYVAPENDGSLAGVTLGGTPYPFTAATNPLILQSGHSIIVYMTNPDSVSVNDIGITIGITVFTANAQYYKECNVAAAI